MKSALILKDLENALRKKDFVVWQTIFLLAGIITKIE